MTPLRVTVLLKTNTGGLWILPQVRELRRRGHEVTVVLPAGPGRLTSALTDEGFPVVESPFDFRFRPRIGTLRGLWRLRQLLGRLRPDVLNYHLYASALAARFSTIRMPLRKVHMVAGPLYLESPLIRAVEQLLWRMDDVTICCTAHLSHIYRKIGVPPERRPVAQYGIDLEYFSPAPVRSGAAAADDAHARAERRAKARAEIGIDDDRFLVVMVGYLHTPKLLVHSGRDIKGHDLLLEAWRPFHARHPRSHLLLIGKGFTAAGEAYRRRLAAHYRVDQDPSVTWLGWVPDLRTYLTAADVGVIPSLSEGSNGVVREASAMGLPTIVSDAGGLPEAVDHRCAWVVPRGDVPALTGALDAAHREFEAGFLVARGEHARRRALQLFSDRAAAAWVVDIIEATARAGRRDARSTGPGGARRGDR